MKPIHPSWRHLEKKPSKWKWYLIASVCLLTVVIVVNLF